MTPLEAAMADCMCGRCKGCRDRSDLRDDMIFSSRTFQTRYWDTPIFTTNLRQAKRLGRLLWWAQWKQDLAREWAEFKQGVRDAWDGKD